MKKPTFQSAVPHPNLKGKYLRDTACGHRHRSYRTAAQCAYRRYSLLPPDTPYIDVVHTNWTLVTRTECAVGMTPYWGYADDKI